MYYTLHFGSNHPTLMLRDEREPAKRKDWDIKKKKPDQWQKLSGVSNVSQWPITSFFSQPSNLLGISSTSFLELGCRDVLPFSHKSIRDKGATRSGSQSLCSNSSQRCLTGSRSELICRPVKFFWNCATKTQKTKEAAFTVTVRCDVKDFQILELCRWAQIVPNTCDHILLAV